MNLLARIVAVAIVAGALVYPHGNVLGAADPPRCSLDESITHELPAGAHVELLLAAGVTVPLDRRRSYEQMARAVLACIGDGTRVEILPVTDSGIGIAPVFRGSVPGGEGEREVPLHANETKAALINDASASISSVLKTTKQYHHSDLLGTLHAAGEALHRSPTHAKLVVFVISNGWHQTQRIDTFRYHVNPAQHSDEVIALLRKEHSLPNLSGTTVVMSGFSPGARVIQMKQAEMVGLCEFWRKIVRASGGSMPLPCEQVLPGLTNHI
jgi:hypothetical protein